MDSSLWLESSDKKLVSLSILNELSKFAGQLFKTFKLFFGNATLYLFYLDAASLYQNVLYLIYHAQ